MHNFFWYFHMSSNFALNLLQNGAGPLQIRISPMFMPFSNYPPWRGQGGGGLAQPHMLYFFD